MGKNDLKNKYKITKHYNHFVKHFIPYNTFYKKFYFMLYQNKYKYYIMNTNLLLIFL